MSSEFARSVFEASPNIGPWNDYKISPESRKVFPASVYSTEGVVQTAGNLVGDNDNITYLRGIGAAVVLDFGFNTCGFYAVEFGADSSENQSIHLSFSESCQFIDKDMADRSMDYLIEDGTLEVPVGEGLFVCPFARQRGAFRYMILSTRKSGSVSIRKVYTTMNNMPSLGENLRNYSGYFFSSDTFANTIWYAGAYTIQLSIIPTNTGRRMDVVSPAKDFWANDVRCGFGEEVLVDGARRDRTIWSGDRGVSQITEFLTFNSDCSINSTNFILDEQNSEGRFPYACEPMKISYASDTYHLWSLKCVHSTVMLNSASLKWLHSVWPKYIKAIETSWNQVDETGTMKVDGPLDWGRDHLKGHATAANCLLYMALKDGAYLADLLGDSSNSALFSSRAETLKSAINSYLWDEKVGMYLDDENSSIHSQDANVLAIWYGIAPEEKWTRISENLTTRWTEFGAIAPEMQNSITPFLSSLELMSHTLAGYPEKSYELFRIMWGYMWNAPYSVKSSLIEGYFGDGTCKYMFDGYDPAYISHCHPWASGPTVWMTNQIVGLSFVDHEHKHWLFAPDGVFCEGSFEFAQSGFTSKSAGFISAGWKKHSFKILQLSIRAPARTTGDIGIPVHLDIEKVVLDGACIDLEVLTKRDRHYLFPIQAGGEHDLVVYYV